MARMSESEIKAAVDSELRNAIGYDGSRLAEDRRKALYYYHGEAKGDLAGPEIDGRSDIVDPVVANVIEWVMPQLMKIFTSGDEAVIFEPVGPEDTQGAQQKTDYANWAFYRKNPGFTILHTMMKDALLSKLGVAKIWWAEQEHATEKYRDLSDEELTLLLADDGVEPVAHDQKPDEDDIAQRQEAMQQLSGQMQQAMQAAQSGDQQAMHAVQQIQAQMQQIEATPPKMLHDLTVKRVTSKGCVKIENVPPEEFLISRNARPGYIPFVAHRVLRTASDLRKAGYSQKKIDEIGDGEAWDDFSPESVERRGDQDTFGRVSDEEGQRRVIWLYECYMPIDADGDGIAEWRKIVRAGDVLLEDEEVDDHPFAWMTPILMPHRIVGRSLADQTMHWQRIKTAFMRSLIDNVYLVNNGRNYAVDGQVNLDDLLNSRPGGVVRVKSPGAVGSLAPPPLGQQAFSVLEYLDGQVENQTGVTKYTQGLDSNAINKTATGLSIISNNAQARIELIARVFAETGIKEIFRKVIKLASQYSTKKEVIRLRGDWVAVDPRAWTNGYDMTVAVGIGTGNKDQQAAHLMALVQQQYQGLAIGIATPKNIYDSMTKFAEAVGIKTPLFTDPSEQQQQQAPQGPPPEVAIEQARAQALMQVEGAKLQASQQSTAAKLQADQQTAMTKAQIDAETERYKAELTAQTERYKAQLNAEAQVISAQQTQPAPQELAEPMEHTPQMDMAAMMQAMAAMQQPINITVPVTIDGKGASVKSGRAIRQADGSYTMESVETPVNGGMPC